MKLKLAENFRTRTQQLFAAAGHDVVTVKDQGLCGCADQQLLDACRSEARWLVASG
ncbi:MAG: DUF5615 family PIN-like protein [bacterium]